MEDLILNYLSTSSSITLSVLALLSLYFILIVWIFGYRYFLLRSVSKDEQSSLSTLIQTSSDVNFSSLHKCIAGEEPSKELLKACEVSIIRNYSKGLSWLAIAASTSPFIGLFGTVVGILESFAKFSTQTKVSFSIIAPAISEALVATAGGIFVAVFAYTFHQIMNRELYELSTFLKAQSEILLSRRISK